MWSKLSDSLSDFYIYYSVINPKANINRTSIIQLLRCLFFFRLALARIRCVNESMLEDELQELRIEQQDAEAGGSDSWNIAKVVTDKTLLLPLLLVCSLQAGQQFSGINAVSIFVDFPISNSTLEVARNKSASFLLIMFDICFYLIQSLF